MKPEFLPITDALQTIGGGAALGTIKAYTNLLTIMIGWSWNWVLGEKVLLKRIIRPMGYFPLHHLVWRLSIDVNLSGSVGWGSE